LYLFLILISILPKETINFTNTELTVSPTPQILSTDPILKTKTPWYLPESNDKITIFFYSNATCKACVQTEKALIDIYNENPDIIEIVWKDFPNPTLNIESLNSAIASRCAEKQNSFWEYHKFLISNYTNAGENLYKEIAQEINLGTWKFNRCYKNQNTLQLVEDSYKEAVDLNVTVAPTIFINNKWYSGVLSKSEIESLILEAKNQAN